MGVWPAFVLDTRAYRGPIHGSRELYAALDVCRDQWQMLRSSVVGRFCDGLAIFPAGTLPEFPDLPVASFVKTPTGEEVSLYLWLKERGLDLDAFFRGWRPFRLDAGVWRGTVSTPEMWSQLATSCATAWGMERDDACWRLARMHRDLDGGEPGLPIFGEGPRFVADPTLAVWATGEGMALGTAARA